MTTINFFLLVAENTTLYIILWVIFFSCYRLLFWKTVKSIFDPIYFFIIFTNSICTTNISFLSILGELRDYYVITYFISEFALLAGLLLLSKPKATTYNFCAQKNFINQLTIGMVFAIFIAVCASMPIYIDRGIPMLLDSRSDASSGGTGLGFLARLSQVATGLFVLLFFIKSKIDEEANTGFEYFMFFVSVVLGVLSGYKAFFIFYLYAYFITRGKNELPSHKKELYVIAIGTLLMVLLFFIVNKSTEIELALLSLLTRIIASGDVYYMAFVDDTIDQLNQNGFIYQLFGTLLASFRLISWDEAPKNLGFALNEIVTKNDMSLGPTFRYNVLWLLLTGSAILTALLSFAVGIVIGLFNRKINREIKFGWGFIFTSFFYFKSFLLILGPDSAINDIFLSALILIILSLPIIGIAKGVVLK